MKRWAGADHWNGIYRQRQASGEDLDWKGRWTTPFLPILRASGARRVLDLGCGTGNDVLRLRAAGLDTVGLDFSPQALGQAHAKETDVSYVAADVSSTLPFVRGSFDAVMSNVAIHMFDDRTTRRLFAELRRVVAANGFLLLHVNSLDDRPLRALHHPPDRELEPNFVLEKDGQTMHFFSESYPRELLRDWRSVDLEHIVIPHRDNGEPFKAVWRVVAN